MKKLLLPFFLFAASIAFAQTPALRFHLVKGDTYLHSSRSTSHISQEVEGTTMTIDVEINGGISFRVLSAADTVYELEVTYTRLGMTMKMPQGAISFSSADTDTVNVLSRTVRGFTNYPFAMKMSNTGRVLEVSKIDEAADHVLATLTDVPEAVKAQVKQQMMESFGENTFKGNFESLTSIYGDAPAKQGTRWSKLVFLRGTMDAAVAVDYEVKEITADYILIEGMGKIKSNDSAAYKPSSGMLMKFDVAGTILSTIKVDPKTGWMIEGKIKQSFSGDSYVKESSDSEAIKIPVTTENNMVFSNR